MKTLIRILIILIAALVVAGAAYALSQTTLSSAVAGQAIGQGETSGRPAPSANSLPNGFSGEREGRGGSFETIGRNLLIIAAVVAAIQGLWTMGRRLAQKKPPIPGRST